MRERCRTFLSCGVRNAIAAARPDEFSAMPLRTLFGTLCAGLLIQICLPGDRPLAVLAVGLASAAIWTCAGIARPKLGRQLAEGVLPAYLLLALGALLILGTLLPQNRESAFYAASFGRAAHAIEVLGLSDLFHSAAFASLLGLLAATLAVSCWRRRARRWRYLAFAGTHLGCLLIIAGAAISFATAEHARLDLRVGAPASSAAEIVREGRATGEAVSLGARVRLLNFEVERADRTPRLARYREMADGDWKFLDSLPARPGQAWELGSGARAEVVELFPDFAWEASVAPAAEGPGALLVAFGGRDHWLIEGSPCLAVGPGAAAGAVGEVCFGDLGDVAAASDPPAGDGAVRQGGPVPGALSFSSDLGDPNHHAHFLRQMMQPQRALRVTFDPERGLVELRAPGERALRPFAEGMAFHGIALRKFHAAAEYRRAPVTRSRAMRHPAVHIALHEGGQRDEALLVAADRDAVRLASGDALTLELSGADITAFQSTLEIEDRGGHRRTALLKVNQPVDVNGWKLYQARFDPGDADFAGLEAVRDRGAPIAFAGFALLIAGLFAQMLLSWRRPGARAA